MTRPFISSKSYAAFALETTPGTDATIDNSQFDVRLRDITFGTEIDSYITDFASGRHSKGAAVMGKRRANIQFTVDTRTGATAGTPAKFGKILRACGWIERTIITFSADLITANTINGSVNAGTSTAITQVTYATSHANTMNLIAAAIQTAGGAGVVATVGGTNGRSIIVTHPTKQIALTGFVVASGASQASVTHSVTWGRHATKDDQTATGWFYLTSTTGNSLIVKTKGTIGNAVLTMSSVGEPLKLVVNMVAALKEIVDGSALTLTGSDTSTPPAVIGATCTRGGKTQRIGSLELDPGCQPQLKQDLTDPTGYLAGYISESDPRLKINPQIELMSVDPVWADWSGGIERAFELITAQSGNIKFKLEAPKAQILTNSVGDRDGEAIWEQELQLHETAGDDEFTLSQIPA